MSDLKRPETVVDDRQCRILLTAVVLGDPGVHMYNQAKYGPVDVITGDYLAEANLANHAVEVKDSKGPGWVPTAWDGLQQTLDIAAEKGIKIVINGGAVNPKGLAEETHKLVKEKGLDLTVAYVDGDNVLHKAQHILEGIKSGALTHLDAQNESVHLAKGAVDFLDHPDTTPVVCANAYLGYRAIKAGLDQGADIVICGRVADASPVIAAAAWWHNWQESDLDQLAGALIGGHLIECSTYVTGANFSGAFRYPPETFVGLGLPIVEITSSGECVVTKHESLKGIVTPDTVKCQLLYELQGNIYLNSDVKADITHIKVKEEATNRVHVSNVKGYLPPPTTKLAVFYEGGHKWDIQEAQIRSKLDEWGITDQLDELDFQRVGVPMENPTSQLASTTYLRVFAQAKDPKILGRVGAAWHFYGMAHFAGMHCTLDMRTAIPKPFLGFYPAKIPQSELEEAVNIFSRDSVQHPKRTVVGPPKATEPLRDRDNYDPSSPASLSSFGETVNRPLGDIALGRSGDKGGNVNIGLYVQTDEEWKWFRSFMTRAKMQELMGRDWQDWYFIERVEMPEIRAVHFVVYGPLGRGVSSSKLLDGLGKGFAEFIRAVHIPIPKAFL
ncbi:hypothetical protein N7470_009384 [Penicillium chermesinum]|nr:hypothetical protein N7470_009384 [Penicillium chermesinum]